MMEAALPPHCSTPVAIACLKAAPRVKRQELIAPAAFIPPPAFGLTRFLHNLMAML
jgi:hypothetical protein